MSEADPDWLDVGGAGQGLDKLAARLALTQKKVLDLPAAPTAAALPVEDLVRSAVGANSGAIRAVTVVHQLHKVAPATAADITRVAVEMARDVVVVLQPNYDANSYLFGHGLKWFTAEWSKNTNLMTSFDLWRMFKASVTGRATLAVLGRKKVANSSHPSIVSLSAPKNISSQELHLHTDKPSVQFDGKVYEELLGIVIKHRPTTRNTLSWREVADMLGQWEVIRVEETEPAAQYAPALPARTGEAADKRKYLFVCGVPRSGTTALTRLLNGHPLVGLGIERFRLQWLAGKMSPELFERQRFFAYQPDDGAPDVFAKYAKDYDELDRKWDDLTVFGDKVPRYYASPPWSAFPSAQLVFIARGPGAVAASWARRARDKSDVSWAETNDFNPAIQEWNTGMRTARRLAYSHPGRFIIVSYDDIFSDDMAAFSGLLRQIGLLPSKALIAFHSELVKDRPRFNPAHTPEELEMLKQADMSTYEELLEIARDQAMAR